MKTFLVGLFLACSSLVVNAQHRHHHYYHHHHHSHSNVLPALVIGGILGAAIANSYEPPRQPIYIQQTNPYETVIIDGQLYIRQIMLVNGIYREVLVKR